MLTTVSSVFFIALLALNAFGVYVQWWSGSLSLKKRYFRWYGVLNLITTLGFAVGMTESWGAWAFMLPATSLVAFPVTSSFVCGSCGRLNLDRMPPVREGSCPQCAASTSSRVGDSIP
jgi:hypothetical protein